MKTHSNQNKSNFIYSFIVSISLILHRTTKENVWKSAFVPVKCEYTYFDQVLYDFLLIKLHLFPYFAFSLLLLQVFVTYTYIHRCTFSNSQKMYSTATARPIFNITCITFRELLIYRNKKYSNLHRADHFCQFFAPH